MADCVSPKHPILFENICLLSCGKTEKVVLVEKVPLMNSCDNKVAFVLIEKASALSEYFEIEKCRDIVIKKDNYYRLEFNVYPIGCPGRDFTLHADVSITPKGFRLTELVESPNYLLLEGVFPAGTRISLLTNPYELRYFSDLEVRGTVGVSSVAKEVEEVNKYDAETKVIYVSSTGRPVTWSPPYPPPNNILFPAVGVNDLLPGQYPSSTTTYPWTTSIIPHEFDQPIPPPLQGQVPVPPVPEGAVTTIIADKFNKRNSVPRVIYYYVGDDIDQCPNDQAISIFLKNIENRGLNNDLKKQYMYAVTVDKLHFYQEKIETFINTVFSKVTIYNKPLVSSFQEELILFFLRVHIGDDDYPQYVIDYFATFIEVIGNGNSKDAILRLNLMFGHVTIAKVLKYYEERVRIIRETKDETTIVYWWDIAGFPEDTLVHESIHNIVAFSQFTNSAYSLAVSSTEQGKVISPNLPPGANTFPNFIKNYNNSTSPSERVNIIRESMRLLVPNAASFSDVEMKEHPGVRVQARHIHQQIMIDNQSGPNNGVRTVQYFTYSTDRYPGYTEYVNLDYGYVAGLKPIIDWKESTFVSPVDKETVSDRVDLGIQVEQAQLIPVFPKPVYDIFGLGYRGCAGQAMSIYIMGRFAVRFADVEWEYRLPGTNYPQIAVAPFKKVYDNVFTKV